MKLRIKGNSVRIRLSKSEVQALSSGSSLEDSTYFGKNSFGYSVQPVLEGNALHADFENGKINMYVPQHLLKEWPANAVVGFESNLQVDDSSFLYLLLEKDFKCIDQTNEDQSDFYENPEKICE